MEINELLRKNFQQACTLPMPKKTYATLSKQGDYAYFSVAPGTINKHFTSSEKRFG